MFSLYIHIPFCKKKCGYCDFCSYTSYSKSIINNYINKICEEIKYYSKKIYINRLDNKISSVFFGGGTPSLISGSDLEKIMSTIRKYWILDQKAELTIECNPDTLTYNKLTKYVSSGINRISIGAQSFDENVLKTLDRTHSVKNVFECLKFASKLKIKSSIDLIYGSPNETLKSWSNTLIKTIDTGINHLSIYALELYKTVPLYKKYKKTNSDKQVEMYFLANKTLDKNGYSWYEISNFSKQKKFQSIHNMNYWLHGNWLGIGTSAHSAIDNKRWHNSSLLNYKKSKTISLTPFEERTEKIMLNLRTSKGLKIDDIFFAQNDLETIKDINQKIDSLKSDKLIFQKNNIIIPTLKGRMLLDTIIKKLL